MSQGKVNTFQTTSIGGRFVAYECGPAVSAWAEKSASLLKLSIVPGDCFVVTRDIIIFPSGYFLTTGFEALCATALYSTLARWPFVGGLLVDYPGTPDQLPDSLRVHKTPAYFMHWNLQQLVGYVRHGLGLPGGRLTRWSATRYSRLVARGRLAQLPSN